MPRKSSSKDLYLLPAKAPNWAGSKTILSIFVTIFQLHLYPLVKLFSSRQLLCGRNGSFCNTFMAKSDFWSSSLPRSLPRRKVKLFLKSFVMQIFFKKRWHLMMRLQNGRHPLPRLDSSQSTPWRTSQEFHRPITRLDASQSTPCKTFQEFYKPITR